MDIWIQITAFIDQNSGGIATRLSETGDQSAEVGRLEAMLTAQFPNLKAETGHDYRHMATQIVRLVLQELEANGVSIGTVNITTVVNSPGATVNSETPKDTSERREPPPSKPIKLNFRKVDDPRLDFNDRLVFSFAWKWAHCNRKAPRTVSLAKYRKATGFRNESIKASLNALMSYGYLSPDHKPLVNKDGNRYTLKNHVKYCGHVKVTFMNNPKDAVFQAVYFQKARKKRGPAWFARSLGICRRTAYNYLAKL